MSHIFGFTFIFDLANVFCNLVYLFSGCSIVKANGFNEIVVLKRIFRLVHIKKTPT